MLNMRTLRRTITVTAFSVGLSGIAAAQDFYRLATLGPGSSPYMVMSTFAQMVSDELDGVQIQVNATGVATQHAVNAANGQLDFFMLAPIVHNNMMEGTAMYASVPDAPELAKNLRSLFIFPLGLYHIVVQADSDIHSLEDIRGKTVFLGPPGGSAAVTMASLLRAATGMEQEKDYAPVRVGWDAAAQAFQDGRIDVYANPTIPPSPVIQQMTLSRQIRLIGLSEQDLAQEGVQGLINRAGGRQGVIEVDVYDGRLDNDEDVATIGSYAGIGTHAGLDEDVIYDITKAFWEAADRARGTTPWLRQVNLEDAFTDLNMPLHPGALRYYREIDIDVPDDLIPEEAR
jgi:TRAP transporter TAXI family solute receptor